MKKWIHILLLIAVTFLYSCEKNEPIQRTNQIPENGLVDHTLFKKIKETNDIGIFNGNSNDITYQWLFLGTAIEHPKDENLNVTFSNAKTGTVKKQLHAEYVQEFSFSSHDTVLGNPSLSIYLTTPWKVKGVELYQFNSNKNKAELIGTTALENSPNAIVTFIPKESKGLFYIVGVPEQKENNKTTGKIESIEKNTKEVKESNKVAQDEYVTDSKKSEGTNKKDKYLTDPVPNGKPKPVEPQKTVISKTKKGTATLSIKCDTILKNLDKFNKDKLSILPKDCVIMKTRTVVFYEGESVYDVLKRETRSSKIHMEMEFSPVYNSVYIEGIHNIYEFDCGELSGWMYKVNGWFPNYGASRYVLKNGDVIEWVYTCDLGRDVGGYVEGVENK